jgi:hypothetical protein
MRSQLVQGVLFGVPFILSACFSMSEKKLAGGEGRPALVRFQNMVGFELSRAGCSILNYGGLDRMCQYTAVNRGADLYFQVGPAFSHVLQSNAKLKPEEVPGMRKLLWGEWVREGLDFYAVSALDLVPSRAAFDAATSGGAVKVHTALKGVDGRLLYSPFFIVKRGQSSTAFLAFSEPQGPTSEGWRIEQPATALKEVLGLLPKEVGSLSVMGHLSKSRRLELAEVSSKPILFLGGEMAESNTTQILKESAHTWFVKAPDLGRGLSEFKVSESKKELSESAVQIGNLYFEYEAILLGDNFAPKAPECQNLFSREVAANYTPCSIGKLKDSVPCKADEVQ